jgi:hypothetical protein
LNQHCGFSLKAGLRRRFFIMQMLIFSELAILELESTASAKCRHQSHRESGWSSFKIGTFKRKSVYNGLG